MKHILYTFSIALISVLSSSAAVITVDNNANSPGQYTNLQTAINAASAGDSIYVSGSNTNYGAISINKRLSLFGTGYNPYKQQPLVSYLSTVSLDTVNSVSGASGSKITGFYMNSAAVNDNYGAKHVTLERNYLYSVSLNVNSSGYLISDNIILSTVTINNATNLVIQNNLIYYVTFYYSNQPSVLIDHNVFMGPIGYTIYCFYQVSFATVTNNIFWGTSPLGTNVINNTFNNDLTFQTTNDDIPGPSNSGANNLVTTNPQFVSAATPGINFSYNYNVSGASAAHNAGTDGTDLGVFGGSDPLPNLSGMPSIPQMINMNINNPVIPPAGTLDVTFKARKNN